MHVEPHTARKRPSTASRERIFAPFHPGHFGIVTICLIIVVVAAMVLLPNVSITRVMAASAAPSKPASIDGIAGNQQVSLSWATTANAAGYILEQTDLVTG